jgi:hypothetical protein
VLANRRYAGYLLVSGSAMGPLFAYVATSALCAAVDERDVADRVLDRLRRQCRRDDPRIEAPTDAIIRLSTACVCGSDL